MNKNSDMRIAFIQNIYNEYFIRQNCYQFRQPLRCRYAYVFAKIANTSSFFFIMFFFSSCYKNYLPYIFSNLMRYLSWLFLLLLRLTSILCTYITNGHGQICSHSIFVYAIRFFGLSVAVALYFFFAFCYLPFEN